MRDVLLKGAHSLPLERQFPALGRGRRDAKHPVRLRLEGLYLVVALHAEAQRGRLAGPVRYERCVQVTVTTCVISAVGRWKSRK